MAEIRQRCGPCGGEFSIVDSIPPDGWVDTWIGYVKEWAETHSCQIKPDTRVFLPTAPYSKTEEKTEDWREQHVGKMCTACGLRLAQKNDLTTYDSLPIHIACKQCNLCHRSSMYGLHWKKTGTGYKQLLVHNGCFKLQEQEHDRAEVLAEEAVHAGIYEIKAEDIIQAGSSRDTRHNRRDRGYGGGIVDPTTDSTQRTEDESAGDSVNDDAIHSDAPIQRTTGHFDSNSVERNLIEHYRTDDDERDDVVSESEHETERTPGA